jgi:hypothetical protein
VKFAKLHETRAEVITQIYALLNELSTKVHVYLMLLEFAPEQIGDISASVAVFQELENLCKTKAIFIPTRTADKLQNINSQLVVAFEGLVFPRKSQEYGTPREVFEHMGDEIKVALGELEDEFRRMLGEEG